MQITKAPSATTIEKAKILDYILEYGSFSHEVERIRLPSRGGMITTYPGVGSMERFKLNITIDDRYIIEKLQQFYKELIECKLAY